MVEMTQIARSKTCEEPGIELSNICEKPEEKEYNNRNERLKIDSKWLF